MSVVAEKSADRVKNAARLNKIYFGDGRSIQEEVRPRFHNGKRTKQAHKQNAYSAVAEKRDGFIGGVFVFIAADRLLQIFKRLRNVGLVRLLAGTLYDHGYFIHFLRFLRFLRYIRL